MRALDPSVARRLDRLSRGHKPRVLDLFSGCGGLSLGFHAAGFEIAGAVEFDRDAAASHAANFHSDAPNHSKARDITSLAPSELASEMGWGPTDTAIDVLVGGPPCQAFARVGRSKLREIADHPEAFRHDSRARLYLEYIRYVREFQPLALVMENVPDVLNHGGQNIAEEMRLFLSELGYEVKYTLVNAAFYGVPQMRERMVLIAIMRDLEVEVSFPTPSHYLELPGGYLGSRRVALKLLAGAPLSNDFGYVPARQPDAILSPATTAFEALNDLPRITSHLHGAMRRAPRRFEQVEPYTRSPSSDFAKLMRSWPDFGNVEGLRDHVIRYLPRDWQLFGRLKPGDQYPQAHAAAVEMFEEALARLNIETGTSLRSGSAEWAKLRASFVPPYDTGKFPNKWRKMEPDRPARTLMAHLGKDSYSHIHYDSTQSRTISVREAARLQSFPDGFVFRGAMNSAFRQIGNAVPPLLSKAVAGELRKSLHLATLNRTRTRRLQQAAQ